MFNPKSPLALKYNVAKAPDVVIIKTATGDWHTGVESLELILDSMEKADQILVEEQK